MAAYHGNAISPAALLFDGDHSLAEQSFRPRELLSGHVNADGSGIVWFDDGAPIGLWDPRPVWQSEGLSDVLRTLSAETVVAAVRNVTPGISADASGTPPIVRGGVALVLNGYLEEFQSTFLRTTLEHLSDPTLRFARGLSDTEFLCLEVVERSRQQDLKSAVVQTVSRQLDHARGASRAAQINLLVSNGRETVGVRSSNRDESNSLYLGSTTALSSSGNVLASEPLTTGDAWNAVPHGSVVDLVSGTVDAEAF